MISANYSTPNKMDEIHFWDPNSWVWRPPFGVLGIWWVVTPKGTLSECTL